MTTLVPTSQNQPGTTTSSTTTGVESYEDMFKEITRKLYGDESAHGLYPINNAQVAQLAQTPSAPPEGERSFTTLVSDRNLAQLEYEGVIQTDGSSNFKSEDHLSTAFGLAALMHNGFPPPAVFPVSNVNSASKQSQSNGGGGGGDERQWSQQQGGAQQNHSQQQDEALWTSNKTTNAYTQKLFKIKTKQEPSEIIINTSSAAAAVSGSSVTSVKSEVSQIQKRYSCSVCPYSTDRRDLFTRHENIHKEEKPFHCYACLKQFNRADHVKKHFLRMHREMDYDINKTRRYPPSSKQIGNSSSNNNNNNNHTTSGANNNNNNNNANNTSSSNNKNSNNFTFYSQQQQQQAAEPQAPPQVPPPSVPPPTATINIPSFTQQHQTASAAQQQQQQQQQQQPPPPQQLSHHHSIEHVIQASANNQQSVLNQAAAVQAVAISIKHEKTGHHKSSIQKVKQEKRFMCCYCSWSGADNWGLKRHLNTHTKPFVCLLCDYKAARSERLTTHILKVHNKKACNKCSFFADDQAQLTQHQIDTHQNETRPARISNTATNNQPSSTQAIATHQSINQPVLSVNTSSNIAGTGNVLRTLTNTFVPNIQTTSSNNVFGTLNSSLNNGVSTIYTTSNTNNIVEQINHHLTTNNWRTSSGSGGGGGGNLNTSNQNVVRSQHTTNTITFTNSSGAHAAKRKSGAERLFAYFEADDSEDLELDYARQLQMQALSRNTSCVAQDFHNAGGENHQPTKGVNSVSSKNRDINLNGTIGQQLLQQNNRKHNSNNSIIKAMSPIDQYSSPPATLELIANSIKRRRKSSSSNDKENVNELLTKQLSFLKQQHQLFLQNLNATHMSDDERMKAIDDINEIFESMYRNSLTIISSIESETRFTKLLSPSAKIKLEPESPSRADFFSDTSADDYKLPAFLKNNKEITVIMNANKSRSKASSSGNSSDDGYSHCEVRKNRKQLKPKKIEKEEEERQQQQGIAVTKASDESRIPNINNLRDKHMLKLVTKKKCCYTCRNKSIDTQKNTKESLLLHNLWRHTPKRLECHRCETRFNKLYKLRLHKTLKKH